MMANCYEGLSNGQLLKILKRRRAGVDHARKTGDIARLSNLLIDIAMIEKLLEEYDKSNSFNWRSI